MDNCVSDVRETSAVNNTMNENVVTQKKCEDSSNDDKIVLSDNFLINLLSRDSTKDVTVESSVEKDKIHEECEMILEQRQSSDNSGTRQDSGTSIVISEDKFETVAEERNVTPENEIRKLPESELVARPDKVPEENIESNAHVEESNIEKENNPRPEVEIVKEISILETPNTDNVKKVPDYRCESENWTDDEDASTSDSSSDSDFFQDICEKSKPKKYPSVKTRGELGLEDLPPIEDLVISVSESEMTLIGKVHAVVEELIVIHSLKGMKALDLDSVLFLSHEQPLGRVFDVLGPVSEPFYTVRFNSAEQINEKGVKIGADVFFAPEKSDITTYVFVEELQNQKGSDASWKHNNEPPEEFLDYSDDEQEKNARRQRRIRNRNQQFSNDVDVPSKRPLLSGDSSNYIPPPKPASPWNRPQNVSYRISRPNPFQTHMPPPPPSPSPSVCSLVSPVRLRNSYGGPSPNQPQRQTPQNVLYRSSPQFLVSPYQQPPHVFGQMAVFSPLSPALHRPSPLPSPVVSSVPTFVPASPLPSPVASSVPTLIPASPFSPPPNYFNQSFPPRTPVSHNQRVVPDPWLHHQNRSPNAGNVPASHPLTVQIPHLSSPPLPVHQFNQSSPAVQQYVNIQNGNFNNPFVKGNGNFNNPFVNGNGNFNNPFVNGNGNFPRVSMQPRFYHR